MKPVHTYENYGMAEEILRYMTGECHHFALALHRMLGWPMAILCDDARPLASGAPNILHVLVQDPDSKNYLDVEGWSSEEDILAGAYAETAEDPFVHNMIFEDQLKTWCGESADHPLDPITEEGIYEAGQLALGLSEDWGISLV